MPIYEYRCEAGHTFEVMQRMSDDPVQICETCEAPVARVFHPVAVHFKGSGFYNTDYGTRKRARENAENANGEGVSKADGSKGEGSKGEGSKGEGSKGDGSSGSKSSGSDSKSSSKSKPAAATSSK